MEHQTDVCPIIESKNITSQKLLDLAIEKMKESGSPKYNLIWLEATGCSGNMISLLNADNPSILFFLQNIVTLQYNNSLMADEGEAAFQRFLDTLNTEFILVVEGAISTKNNGLYTVIARYHGQPVTALDAVSMAGEKAKYVVAVGTCASFGGISSGDPNPSESKSVDQVLSREVIKAPGCPSHPDWAIGTIAYLVTFGIPELDEQKRPIMIYGITIHDRCTRRSYFDKGVFSQRLGERFCMFKLGCRGPVTKTDCPVRKWNSYVNWPVEDNTPCIGCAQDHFPDGMEPFVRY